MTLTSAALQRLVWITGPAALYFAARAIEHLNRGASWNASAHAVMAVLVVAVPVIARGRVLGGEQAAIWLGVMAMGMTGWLAAATPSVQVVGFIMAVASQLAMARSARRSGTEAPPVRDDSAIELGVGR